MLVFQSEFLRCCGRIETFSKSVPHLMKLWRLKVDFSSWFLDSPCPGQKTGGHIEVFHTCSSGCFCFCKVFWVHGLRTDDISTPQNCWAWSSWWRYCFQCCCCLRLGSGFHISVSQHPCSSDGKWKGVGEVQSQTLFLEDEYVRISVWKKKNLKSLLIKLSFCISYMWQILWAHSFAVAQQP